MLREAAGAFHRLVPAERSACARSCLPLAELDRRYFGRFSNTSFAIGIAENTFGQPA